MKALYLFVALAIVLGNSIFLDAQDWTNRSECETFLNAREKLTPLDPIEGIWAMSYDILLYNQRKKAISEEPNEYVAELVIVKDEDGKYGIYDLDGKPAYFDLGFKSASLPGQYLFNVKYPDTKTKASAEAVFGEDGRLLFSYRKPAKQVELEMGRSYREGMYAVFDHKWLKLFPEREFQSSEIAVSAEDIVEEEQNILQTNNAFLLSERYGIAVLSESTKNANIRIVDESGNESPASALAYQDETGLLLFELEAASIHKELGPDLFPLKKRVSALGEDLVLFFLNGGDGAKIPNSYQMSSASLSSQLGRKGQLDRFVVESKSNASLGSFLFDDQLHLAGIETSTNADEDLLEFFHSPKVMELLARISADQQQDIDLTSEERTKKEAIAEFLKKRVFLLQVFE